MTAHLPTLILFLVLLLAIYGALSDLGSFRIPNWVSYGLVGLFVVYSVVLWFKTPFFPQFTFRLPMWAEHAIVGLVVFVAATVFWKLRFIGGGDVKYLTATALWIGPRNAVVFFILITVLAFVFVGVLKFLRLWDAWFQQSNTPAFVKRALEKAGRNELPYGFPIGVAFVILAPRLFTQAANIQLTL